MVEAAVMLPVLVMMLLAVTHGKRVQEARITATAEARRCAFEHAYAGCGAPPAGCTSELGGPKAAQGEGVAERVDEEVGGALSSGAPRSSSIRDYPLIGGALEAIWGERVTAVATETYVSHLPGRRSRRTARGEFTLVCNPPPRPERDVARELFDALNPF